MLLLSFATLTDEQRVRRYKPSSWTSTTTTTSSVAAELESVGEIMEAPYGTRVLSPDVAAALKFINQDPTFEQPPCTPTTGRSFARPPRASSLSNEELTLGTLSEAGSVAHIALEQAADGIRVVVCASRLSRRGVAKLKEDQIRSKHLRQLAFAHEAARVLQTCNPAAPTIRIAFFKELGSLLDDGSWDRRETVRNCIEGKYVLLSNRCDSQRSVS